MAYKYFAFISYNSKDTEWGKKLQRKLEHYRMPATLCSEHNWQSRTPINPVFFAPTDIQPGGLSDELKQRLEASEHLIVICSPNSAKSEWVGKEIAYFYSLGRPKNIHFFIVDGIPHSGNEDTECFNPILKDLDLPEILGANIHEKIFRWSWLNKERAYIQLITKLLNIDFDTLWNRHHRLLIEQAIAWTIGAIAVIIAIVCAFFMSQPVDVEMSLNEVTPVNNNLPPLKNARVSLVLANEKKDTTFLNIGEKITFTNVPHDMIGKKVKVHFAYNVSGTDYYLPLDTALTLSKHVVLNISRNVKAYGHVHFNLLNSQMKPMPDTQFAINGIPAQSDANGHVDIIIPLEKQYTFYNLTSSTVQFETHQIDAQCGDNDAVLIK